MPMVEAVMSAAALDYAELDGVAATIGPGSFTGVRVGLAAARGLALAAGVPLVGVTTLETLATSVPAAEREGRTVLAVLDARRGQVYAQMFDADNEPLGPPEVTPPAAVVAWLRPCPVVVVGSGAPLVAHLFADIGHPHFEASVAPYPDAAQVAARAAALVAAAGGFAALPRGPVAPLYLRGPGAGGLAETRS